MSVFVIGKSFSIFDTWTLLLIYLGSAQIAVLIGFVASGRRRGWWRRKSKASVDDPHSGTNAGVSRGLHRMPWEIFYVVCSFYAVFISIAQWIVATDQNSCNLALAAVADVDASDIVKKSCEAIVGATSFLYVLQLVCISVYSWSHLSHCYDFAVAIFIRCILAALTIVQLALYAGMGSVGAPIIQSAVVVLDCVLLYIVVRAYMAMKAWRVSRQGILPITHAIDDDEGVLPSLILNEDGFPDELDAEFTSRPTPRQMPEQHSRSARASSSSSSSSRVQPSYGRGRGGHDGSGRGRTRSMSSSRAHIGKTSAPARQKRSNNRSAPSASRTQSRNLGVR